MALIAVAVVGFFGPETTAKLNRFPFSTSMVLVVIEVFLMPVVWLGDTESPPFESQTTGVN